MTTQKELATLLHRRFFQRRDAFAEYGPTYGHPEGCWHPVERPIKGSDLLAHLEGERFLGTYLVDADSQVRFFTLDIDFNPEGTAYRVDFPTIERKIMTDPSAHDDELAELWPNEPDEISPRDEWLNVTSPYRPWLAFQVRCLAAGFAYRLKREYQLDTAVTYSGGKGMHVHCFCGERSARDARYMANKMLGSWKNYETMEPKFFPVNGFAWRDSTDHYSNFTIEVFPKQDEIAARGFGNLVRLPLGVHPKTKQRSHFINLDSIPAWQPLAELDAEVGLTRGSV